MPSISTLCAKGDASCKLRLIKQLRIDQGNKPGLASTLSSITTDAIVGCKVFRSNGDPLDDVSGYSPLPSVVEPGRTRIGVTGKQLYVLQREPVGEQVGDRRNTE